MPGVSHQALMAGFGGSGLAASRSYRSLAASGADASSYNFAGLDLGTIATGKKNIVCAWGEMIVSGRTINSITVDGIAASLFGALQYPTVGGNMPYMVWGVADVPAASSGDVVVGCSDLFARCGVLVWAAYDLLSSTPISTDNESANATAMTGATSADGIVLAGAMGFHGTATTWTGATEDVDGITSIDAVNLVQSGASALTTGAAFSITGDFTGAGPIANRHSFIAGAWR